MFGINYNFLICIMIFILCFFQLIIQIAQIHFDINYVTIETHNSECNEAPQGTALKCHRLSSGNYSNCNMAWTWHSCKSDLNHAKLVQIRGVSKPPLKPYKIWPHTKLTMKFRQGAYFFTALNVLKGKANSVKLIQIK